MRLRELATNELSEKELDAVTGGHGDEPLFAQSLSPGANDTDHDGLAFVDVAATAKNEAPVTHDTRVKTALSNVYVFAISDFPFREDDAGGHLSAVEIETLPTAGRLTLGGVDVQAGQKISFESIAAGRLVFSFPADIAHIAHARFTFAVIDASGAVSADKAMMIDRLDVHRRPTTHNTAITTPKDTTYVFQVADFPFAEAGDRLAKVEFERLPIRGLLTLGGVAVKPEDKVAVADIAAGKLVYTPPAGASGWDFSELRFEVVDSRGKDSAAATLTINVVIPPTVTIAPIDGNNVINSAEAHAGVPLSGTVAGIAPGSTFSVSVTDAGAVKTYTATVDAAGVGWTAFIPSVEALALANGIAIVTAQVTDANGIRSAPASQSVTVVETPTVSLPQTQNS